MSYPTDRKCQVSTHWRVCPLDISNFEITVDFSHLTSGEAAEEQSLPPWFPIPVSTGIARVPAICTESQQC